MHPLESQPVSQPAPQPTQTNTPKPSSQSHPKPAPQSLQTLLKSLNLELVGLR